MYTVILVDDEKWIVQSIKAKGEWTKHGLNIVGESYNGDEAFCQIISKKPDVVITDIRMPGMSGLELIKKVRLAGLNAEFIVISGYSDFDYVKEALQLGAFDYMLKSVDEEELDRVLERMKLKLDRSKESAGIRLFALLQNGEPSDNEDIGSLLFQNGLPCNSEELRVFSTIGEGELLFGEDFPYISMQIGSKTKAYLVSQQDEAAFLEQLNSHSSDFDGAGIGIQAEQLYLLGVAIRTAVQAAMRYFLTGRKGEVHTYRPTSRNGGAVSNQLLQAMKNRDVQSMESLFAGLLSFLQSDQSDIQYAVNVYNILLLVVQHSHVEEQEEFVSSSASLVSMFPDVSEMLSYLQKISMSNRGIDHSPTPEIAHETLKEIVITIETHFSSNISIQTIAEQFNLHPNYVSQLFQKEMKTTFTQVLLNKRIQHACLLLKETNLAITDIAEKTGYQDYFYFAKVFKKKIGQTPTEYRTTFGTNR